MNKLKKIIGLFLICSIFFGNLSIFAAEESEILSYLDTAFQNYNSESVARENADSIIGVLLEKFSCTEEEAETYFEEMIALKYPQENQASDNNTQTEEPEDVIVEESNNISDETLSNYNVLYDFGLIENEDGTFDFEKKTIRGEFAEIIARIMTYKSGIEHITPSYMFLDIDETNEYYSYIANGINMGIVEGYDDGTFKPEQEITADEAIRMVLRAMGYRKKVEIFDDKNLYYGIADELELLDNVKAGMNDYITNSDMINIVYNALLGKMYIAYINDTILYTEGESMLEYYMNISWSDGLVDANERTSIYLTSDCVSDNSIRMNEIVYTFNNERSVKEYLGLNVRLFYDKDEYDNGISVKPIFYKNDKVTVTSNQIEEYKDGYLYYYEEESSTKTDKIKIDVSSHIIFNGSAVSSQFDNLIFTPQIGEVVFLNNDKDSEYDVIFINSYVPYLLNDTGIVNPALQDEFGIQPKIEIDDDYCTFVKNGAECDYTDFVSGNVVLVASDAVTFVKNGDTYYMLADTAKATHYTMHEITYAKDGSIESKSGNDVLVAEDVEYKISDYFKAIKNSFDNEYFKIPPIGSVVNLKLDMHGNVIAIDVTGYGSDIKYAWLKKAVFVDDDPAYPDGALLFKVYTQDDEHINLFAVDSLRVHRKWNETSSQINESSYYGRKEDADKLLTKLGGTLENQLIKYSLKSDGTIKEVYIAETDYLSKPMGADLNFYRGNGIFSQYWQGTYNYAQGCFYNKPEAKLFFQIPQDISKTDAFKVSQADITGDSNNIYYDANEIGVPTVVVEKILEIGSTGAEVTIWDSFTAIVDGVEEYYDEASDQIKYKISLYHGKTVNKTRVASKYEYDFDDNLTTYKVSTAGFESYSQVPIKNLKRGDIIYITLNSDKTQLVGAGMVSLNTGKRDNNNKVYVGTHISAWLPNGSSITLNTKEERGRRQTSIIGFVKKRVENVIYVDDGSAYIRRTLAIKDAGYVFIYDKKSGKITPAQYGDIRNGDYIIGYTNMNDAGETVYVIRNY